MKKACDNCQALDGLFGERFGKKFCRLEFKIERAYDTVGLPYNKPKEECPKPMTYKKFQELLNEKKDGKYNK